MKTAGASGIKSVGIVTQGSLTGLYTRPVENDNYKAGMIALRIGNDDLLGCLDPPHTTDISNPFSEGRTPEGARNGRVFRMCLDIIDASIIRDYDRRLEEMRGKSADKRVHFNEMFLRLCRELGIRIDLPNMHLIRHRKHF